MQNLPKILLSGVLFMASLAPAASAAEKSVVVIAKDGTSKEVLLSAVQRIEIGSTGITLHHSEGETHAVEYANVDRVLIGAESAAIDGIVAKGNIAVWPTAVTSNVNIAGLANGAVAAVYSIDGRCIASQKAGQDGKISFDLSNAAAGTYIVKADKTSVKIVKH